jgi:hypothetical protein
VGRNRLAEEYRSNAELAWMLRGLSMPMAGLALLVLVLTPGSDALKALALAAGTVVTQWLRHRRYTARARWMTTTDRWWERLDEAPTLLAVSPHHVGAAAPAGAHHAPAAAPARLRIKGNHDHD